MCTFRSVPDLLYTSAMASTLEDLDQRVIALERSQGDTTQTLRWVVAKLGRIQAVQDEHTLRLERIEGGVENVEAHLEQG
jgi:hypothetical protein